MTHFERPDEPAISVLLPARQAADTLAAALESVARQDVGDWECLIVDDGSTDATEAVARRFAAKDPRFRWLRGGHAGLVATLNRGLAACRGRYVARFDADDLCRRSRLRLQLRALENDSSLALVGSHVRTFPRPPREGRRRYEAWLGALDSPEAIARDRFIECPLAHPTWFARVELLRELGGYRDVGWAEDYDLLLRACAAGHRLGVVPRRLVGWRDGETRLQRRDERYSLEAFTRCRAHFLASDFLAGGDTYVLWGHGGTGRALRRALADEGQRPHAIVELHPGRLGNAIDGAPVVEPSWLGAQPRGRLVVSVAGDGPRGEIRSRLQGWGWIEGVDFVCAA